MMPLVLPVVEVCADNMASVQAAARGGADRVELCARLDLDGLTPSDEMIAEARAVRGLMLHVLVRPRAGDFVYTPKEIDEMAESIDRVRRHGVDGVVFGALLPSGEIDREACSRLMKHTRGLNVTFHRAFDVCANPLSALEDIIALGFNRILTSGQASTAEAGIPLLRWLTEKAGQRLTILPGAGVNADNAVRILRKTGAREIHGSFRQNGIADVEVIRYVKKSKIILDE